MAYSTDSDLEEVQYNAPTANFSKLAEKHLEAELMINRAIKINWFRSTYPDLTFNPALLDADSLKRLSVYKVLELAYLSISMGIKDDSKAEKMKEYKARYDNEFSELLADGFLYDANDNGIIDDDEQNLSRTRVLVK